MSSRWLVALVAMCGCSPQTGGDIAVTGGEVCYLDEVCLEVPPGGLARPELFRITRGVPGPPAGLSATYDISTVRVPSVTFLVPAKISFRLDLVDATGVPSENLLRIHTRERLPDGTLTDTWVSLDRSAIDRVRGLVVGETSHLSPFVVLRADRDASGGIPDGG